MSGVPFFEVLTGTIDGVNDTFFFSKAYTAGSVALYLNGQLLVASPGNPWVEVDPSTGEVRISVSACIPKTGDQIAGFAIDTTDGVNTVEVTELLGSVTALDRIGGSIESTEVEAALAQVQALAGQFDNSELLGEVQTVSHISGVLEYC